MGEITFTNNVAAVTGQYSPRDFSLDGSYSRMLSENLGIGLTAKYIYSNLTGTNSNVDGQAGQSVAVDFGLYYTKDLKWKNESTLSFGVPSVISGQNCLIQTITMKTFCP